MCKLVDGFRTPQYFSRDHELKVRPRMNYPGRKLAPADLGPASFIIHLTVVKEDDQASNETAEATNSALFRNLEVMPQN